MAQQTKPDRQIEFGGVHTAGHPIQRPKGTSVVCENYRIMPGNWLRLRSGRRARNFIASGQIVQMFDAPPQGGHPFLQQVVTTTPYWKEIEVDTFTFYGAPWEKVIETDYDDSYATSNRAAICSIRTKNVLYNGLGVRDATNSRPPFSIGNILNSVRYFGIDAYCPDGNPTVAFAAGAGYNSVITSVKIWVGLYNTGSLHYSNGVYCGEIETTDATGTITVSNLNKLSVAYNDGSEEAELKYVFYATVDGGQIPYLILNDDLNGPHTVAISETSASLSRVDNSADLLNGWVLNLDAEMPTENFPPRPMKQIVWVNGRVYGIPLDGGSGSSVGQETVGWGVMPDFTYQFTDRYLAGIVYSSAGSDFVDRALIGNPEECWPVNNWTPTPTGEYPVAIAAAPDGMRLQVLTETCGFLVEEIVDRVHEWKRVGQSHGVVVEETLVETDYGNCWVTQRNEVVLLRPNTLEVEVLSAPNQSLIGTKTPRFGRYIKDPLNELDQYRVYFTDGTSYVHDFATGWGSTSTNQDYTSAGTLTDHCKRKWHFTAKQHIYTEEGQGDTGTIPTADEEFGDNSTDIDYTAIEGTWESQWEDFGDDSIRKELSHVEVVGDEPTVEWYADMEQVAAGNTKTAVATQAPQSETPMRTWRAKLTGGCNRFWFKFVLKLTGSATQGTYDAPAEQGRLATNFTGCIMRFLTTIGTGENRR